MSARRLILLSTWFQLIWFLAILGREEWLWLTLSLVFVTQVLTVGLSQIRLGAWLGLLGLGVCIDYANYYFGLFQFEPSRFPIWLILLWAIFLWYANYLTPILNQYHPVLVSLVSGIAGAMSYFAGMKLQAVAFPHGNVTTLLVLFIEWSLLIIVIKKVYSHEPSLSVDQKGANF